MKKLIILLLTLVSFFSSCMSVNPYAVKEGEIVKKEYPSIDNPFYTEEIQMVISRGDTLSITKWTSTDKPSRYASLSIRFVGTDWRFMDGDIIIKADDKIFRYKDGNPKRDVRSGGVSEKITVFIPKDELSSIANSTTLLIQYYGSPVKILDLHKGYISNFYNQTCNDLTR